MIKDYNGIEPTIGEGVFVAENATVLGNVELKAGANVWFSAVIRGDSDKITIGENVNIQDNCTVHSTAGYPVNIEENVTVGHNAVIHGCTVGRGSLIGMSSTIMNGAVIGEGSVVGAGALVTENKKFEPHSLIMGVPAKAVSKIEGEEALNNILKNAEHYKELSEKYKNEGF